MTEEPKRPMAVKEPSMEETIKALQLRVTMLEEQIQRHERYHFGKKE
jgi:hypothetical protein